MKDNNLKIHNITGTLDRIEHIIDSDCPRNILMGNYLHMHCWKSSLISMMYNLKKCWDMSYMDMSSIDKYLSYLEHMFQ